MLLIDTHVWAWAMLAPDRLSTAAMERLLSSPTVHVSAISLYEVAQKTRLGKWPEMVPHLSGLAQRLVADGFTPTPMSAEISLMAGSMEWSHRDPFDRFIAATALHHKMVLLSADRAFDELSGLHRIW